MTVNVHIARYLEEIALTVLPTNIDSEDGTDLDSGLASSDTTTRDSQVSVEEKPDMSHNIEASHPVVLPTFAPSQTIPVSPVTATVEAATSTEKSGNDTKHGTSSLMGDTAADLWPLTMADTYIDDLYKPSFMEASAASTAQEQSNVPPSKNLLAQRLQTANRQHMSATGASSSRSPFRHGSPLAPESNLLVQSQSPILPNASDVNSTVTQLPAPNIDDDLPSINYLEPEIMSHASLPSIWSELGEQLSDHPAMTEKEHAMRYNPPPTPSFPNSPPGMSRMPAMGNPHASPPVSPNYAYSHSMPSPAHSIPFLSPSHTAFSPPSARQDFSAAHDSNQMANTMAAAGPAGTDPADPTPMLSNPTLPNTKLSRIWKCPILRCKYHEHGWPTERRNSIATSKTSILLPLPFTSACTSLVRTSPNGKATASNTWRRRTDGKTKAATNSPSLPGLQNRAADLNAHRQTQDWIS